MSRLVAALCFTFCVLATLQTAAAGSDPRRPAAPEDTWAGSAAASCADATGPVPISRTTVVQGPYGAVRVHECLALPLTGLLNAAEAAGHTLGAWGYRSYEDQVAVRKKNCSAPPKKPGKKADKKPDQNAPKKKPGKKSRKRAHGHLHLHAALKCRVPTAKPGTSMHERGLAVDLTSAGASLTPAAFAWLRAHAPGYGLHNLPSEPWHWSTNGH